MNQLKLVRCEKFQDKYQSRFQTEMNYYNALQHKHKESQGLHMENQLLQVTHLNILR